MATSAPSKSKNKKVSSSSPSKAIGLFDAEDVLFNLKLGSIDVPVVKEGKGQFVKVSQGQWTMEHQRAILDYWAEQKKENPKFDINAKKAKLFVMPDSSDSEDQSETSDENKSDE